MKNPYYYDWDSATYILVITGMLISPALLALPWAWFTRIPRVRVILPRAFMVALAAPFLCAGLYALFTRLCVRGHVDQPFDECGAIPGWLADLIVFGSFYLLAFLTALAALYCATLEIRRFLRSE